MMFYLGYGCAFRTDANMRKGKEMTHRVAWTLELKPLASLPALEPMLRPEMLEVSFAQLSIARASRENDDERVRLGEARVLVWV